MFFPISEPGSPDPRRFVVLRTSLNAPVVSTEDIPSGPARAAIAMWFEDDQSCSLEVRVRSVATGRMVVYAWEGELSGAREVDTALDAGLSFAESMGFLFDDDAVRDDGARKWTEFLAEAAPDPETLEQPAGVGPPAMLLSKFRLRPVLAPPGLEPLAGAGREQSWVRLLSRF
jgi:hypothetical protein